MKYDESQGSVDRLREKLYSKTKYREPDRTRKNVNPAEDLEVEKDWNSPELDEMLKRERHHTEPHPIMKKFFTASLVFFVIALGVAAFVFLGGSNFISSENVDIRVVADTNAPAGEVFEMEIVVTNKNNADLQVANLSIQYPQGTRDPEDTTSSLNFVVEELGSIGAGREKSFVSRAVFFGEEGEVKQIRITVDYEVTGSNATFKKDKVYEVAIGESPVSINISKPSTVTSSEVFATTITLALNTPETLKNVVLRGEYPYGYSVVDSNPASSDGGNMWFLGDLEPGSTKTVIINGQLLGEDEAERTFRYYLGVADSAGGTNLGSTISSVVETVAIRRPSISLDLLFNGQNVDSYSAPAGGAVNASVRYRNNLSDRIINPRLTVLLGGEALNEDTVSVTGGFYDSRTNTITWDISNSSGNSELRPGDSGTVNFKFSPLSSLPSGISQEINLEAVLSGTSVSDARVFSVKDAGSVRVASQATLTTKTLHSVGAFVNTGSVPPKAEEETTYTLVFTLGNTRNDIENGRLTAVLGPGVTWLGASSEDVTFNATNKTITWNVGTLRSGAGFSAPSREASVQIGFIPSTNQAGTTPNLASGVYFSGTDAFTGQTVTLSSYNLTTRMPNDPAYVQGDDRVVK